MSSHRLFKNSTLTLSAKLGNALIQVLCLPVLLTTFGKSQYGLIVVALSLNTFIAILQLGLPSGIPKFVAEWLAKEEHQQLQAAMQSVASFYIFLALLNGLVLLSVAYFGIDLFHVNPDQVETLRTLLVITAITSCIAIPVTALDQLLIGANELGFVSGLQMVKNLFFAGLVASVYLHPDLLSLPQFYAIQCALMFLMVPFKILRWRHYGSLRVFLPGWNLSAALPLLKFCLSMMVFSIFTMIARKFTPILLAIRVEGDAGNVMAEYQILNSFEIFLIMVSGSFIAALIPYVSGSVARGDQGIFRKVITEGTKVVWAFGALVGFGVIMLSKEALLVYVGEDYLHLQPWLALYVTVLLYNLYNPAMSSAILASGKLVPLVCATGIGCLVSISICWILAPFIGVGSVVYALMAYMGIYFLVTHFWYFPRYFGISPVDQIVKIMLPPVGAGLIMCFAGRGLIHLVGSANNWINIGIGIVCGTFVYSIVILTIYIRPQELKMLVQKLRKSKSGEQIHA